MSRIILATTSRYKRALFERLYLPHVAMDPEYEEVLDPNLEPESMAKLLARQKAEAVSNRHARDLVIGSDQLLVCGSETFTKPGTTKAAVQQLLKLAGTTHQLHSAYCLLRKEPRVEVVRVVTSHLTFHSDLEPEFLYALVEAERSQDCVGGYRFESRGICLIEGLDTPDPTAIVGLPLIALVNDLRRLGWTPGLL